MTHLSDRRSGIFLLELIIAVLFLSMTSAACIQIFVKSHTLSKEAADLNQAVQLASGWAERFLATEDVEEQIGGQGVHDSGYYVYYDENWETTTPEDASYYLLIQIKREGSLLQGNFSVYKSNDNKEPIYDITTGKCMREEDAS